MPGDGGNPNPNDKPGVFASVLYETLHDLANAVQRAKDADLEWSVILVTYAEKKEPKKENHLI